MTSPLLLRIDPNATPVNMTAFMVASVVNEEAGNAMVTFEWKTGSPLQLVDAASSAVLCEGSSVAAGIEIIRRLSPASADSEWITFATDSLAGNDFSRLAPAYARLNEHLCSRTFIAGAGSAGVIDALLWGQLKASPVWAKLVKTPGSAAGVESTRWFNALTEVSFAPAMSAFAGEAKALKEKKRDQGSFAIDLEGAKQGSVVTRFPPEPSGYLHIGHAKAAMLNQYFAQAYSGQMIVRFDDTNPSKEKCEFEESILEDLALLGVKGDRLTHTSDYFPQIEAFCVQMLQEGTAYADNTPLEQMREERFNGIESACRAQSPEENLRLWEEMKAGSERGLTYCIRAKLDMSCPNKAMRDPVMYRCNVAVAHHRTGWQYKVYPTYDFACPIVDSLEGVTHALRTNEYHDRNDQYAWFLEAMRLRKVAIWDYSRLNFVYTLLSKRKLTWFVDAGRVSGWDDPRFPTVRGIRRRGLTIEALREYILMQGASKNTLLLEWDKLWAINKRIIDPTSPRYTALSAEALVRVEVVDEIGDEQRTLPRHKKNAELGSKSVWYSKSLLMEQADCVGLKEGEEFTLMDWGNAIVKNLSLGADGKVTGMQVALNLQGDFKKTALKATWLAAIPAEATVPVFLYDYDYLITKKKLEEEDTLDDCLTPVTEFVTEAVGDANMARDLKKGDIVQLERKGFFIVDACGGGKLNLIAIPDGKAKSIASKHN